jgi:cytochrome c556
MRRLLSPLSLAVLGIASLALAQTAAPTELRPLQVVMRARAAWMKSMNENLTAQKLPEVAMAADELSAQASKVAEGAKDEPKELHLKVAALAKEVAAAANAGQPELVKAKLGDISQTCSDCHAKYRPKP